MDFHAMGLIWKLVHCFLNVWKFYSAVSLIDWSWSCLKFTTIILNKESKKRKSTLQKFLSCNSYSIMRRNMTRRVFWCLQIRACKNLKITFSYVASCFHCSWVQSWKLVNFTESSYKVCILKPPEPITFTHFTWFLLWFRYIRV